MAEPKTEEDKVRELKRLTTDADRELAKFAEIHRALRELADHFQKRPRPSR